MPTMIPSEGREAALRAFLSEPLLVRPFVSMTGDDGVTASSFKYAEGTDAVTLAPGKWVFEDDRAKHPTIAFRFSGLNGTKTVKIRGCVFLRKGKVAWVYYLQKSKDDADPFFPARFAKDEFRVQPVVRWPMPK